MGNVLPRIFTAVLIFASCELFAPARADEMMKGAEQDIERLAENTSIIFFRQGIADEGKNKVLSVMKRYNGREFDGGNAILIPVAPALIADEISKLGLKEGDAEVVPDMVYRSYASYCEGDDELPNLPQTEEVPKGVTRVFGGTPSTYGGQTTVWILDTGIADDQSTADELNVVLRKKCDEQTCSDDTETDTIGHGTMLAGIVGARANSKGLVGVAPDVRIASVKIFDQYPLTLGSNVLTALELINLTASAGDVVNMSWGQKYPLRAKPATMATLIEERMREIARTKSIRFVVAAGNTDAFTTSGYVQELTPARAGGYHPGIGGIFTISAVKTVDQGGGIWQDTFWKYSAFGNGRKDDITGKQLGPPDYAAPGFNVKSLWPGGKINFCSGTSFAAAHVSGLLVYGVPKKSASSRFDPSAIKPGRKYPSQQPGDYDPKLLDPVATKN